MKHLSTIKLAVLLLLITSLVVSCNEGNEQETATEDDTEIVRVTQTGSHPELPYTLLREVDIPLDRSEIQYDFQASQVYKPESGATQFWGLDAANNTINVFDLQSNKYLKSIQIPKEGPDAIEFILNFHVHSPDSIFIMPGNTGKFHLINSEGNVLNKWNYSKLKLPNGKSLMDNFPFPLAELGAQFYFDKKDNTLVLPLWLRGGGKFYKNPPIARLQ